MNYILAFLLAWFITLLFIGGVIHLVKLALPKPSKRADRVYRLIGPPMEYVDCPEWRRISNGQDR